LQGKIPVFVFDWRDDPRKDEDWYNEQCDKFDSIIVAQEIDRDYSGSVEQICIPAKWVKAAIDFDIADDGMQFAGLDVADEGADANALILRKGPVVFRIEEWKEGNTSQTTKKAWFIMRSHNARVLKYDKIGVGAGVKGELSNTGYEQCKAVPVDSGASPTPGRYEKGNRPNKDMFRNFKAEMWWKLRRRFERVWEHKNGINEYHEDDMISIPNDPRLVAELSQVKYKFTDTGKIKIESKEELKRRGIKSPNIADALAICFAPEHRKRAGAWGKKRTRRRR